MQSPSAGRAQPSDSPADNGHHGAPFLLMHMLRAVCGRVRGLSTLDVVMQTGMANRRMRGDRHGWDGGQVKAAFWCVLINIYDLDASDCFRIL